MKVDLIDHSSVKKTLDFEVPAGEVAGVIDGIVQSFAKHAKVPGFRPGRAPREIIRQRYKEEIVSEMLKELVPSRFSTAIQERQLEVVGEPRFESIDYSNGQPLRFKASFEVFPQLNITNYVGIPVEAPDTSVRDEEVESTVRDLQDKNAELNTITETRTAAKGDFVEISYTAEVDGSDEPPVSSRGVSFEIGAATTLDDFSSNLTGALPGDERKFEVSYPDDYPGKAFAGKTVRYTVSLEAIKEKKVPELNDEFAQSIGEFKTMDELRADIRTQVGKRKTETASERQREAVLDWLAKNNEFELPEQLVQSQTQVRLERLFGTMMRRGVNPKELGWDWEKVRHDEQARAINDVRGSLILEHIADKENIQVSDEEIDAEIERVAGLASQPVGEVKQFYSEDGARARLRGRIRNDKTFALLIERATIQADGAAAG